jgi:hypothetical protein
LTWTKVVIDDEKAEAHLNTQVLAEAKPEPHLLLDGIGAPSGLFPAGLRWISPDWKTVVIERPPQFHTMAYAAMMRSGAHGHKQYRIPVPWQVYIVRFSGDTYPPALSAFVRPAQLEKLDDPLYVYPLPNVGGTGGVCMHVEDSWPEFIKQKPAPALADRAFFMINALWMSGFNHNMGNVLSEQFRHAKQFQNKVAHLDGHKVLEELEKVPLTEIVNWDFPTTGMTILSMVENAKVAYPTQGSTGQQFVDQVAYRIYNTGKKR